jgi:hypothetical protein
MESPINIVVAKITGTLVYRGFGTGSIESRHGSFKEQPIEIVLDNEEENPSTVHFLPNGNLCVYSCIGDEQPSSTLQIIKDWKIEHVPHNVPVMESEEFEKMFTRVRRHNNWISGMPKELENLFNHNG